jgi:serine phosphatase RsbU (regulator of sigma subunit)
VLVCFTEGLIQAWNGQDEEFGLDQLNAAIRKGAARGAEEVQRRVLASLDWFLAGARLQDDLTLLAVERRP